MPTNRIQLGATYRDVITGFEGVCIGRYDYLTGCQRLTLQATHLTDEGQRLELTLDAAQVEFVEFTQAMTAFAARQRGAQADPAAAG